MLHASDEDVFVQTQRANEGWHHDSSYLPVLAKGALVTADVVPTSGGATGWADMCAAYDALSPELRATARKRTAHHSLYYSQVRAREGQHDGAEAALVDKAPGPEGSGKCRSGGYPRSVGELKDRLARDGIVHGRLAAVCCRPLASMHPDTGRYGLRIGEHAFDVSGLEAEQSERLLEVLLHEACQAPRVYYHQWVAGDVAIWDNRRLVHRATSYELTEPRRLWHTRIAGGASDGGLGCGCCRSDD